jgi:4-coumarate--CoA ligase
VQKVGRESSGGLWGCDKKHPETPGLDTTAASIRAHAVHPHKGSACLTISYKQLHRTALRLAAGILANGGRAGSRMVMFIPNGGEYAILLWTCILLRVTYVSLEPDLLDISGFTALKHMLKALRPQIVVVPDVATGRAIDVAVAELKLPQPVGLSLAACPGRPRAWKSLADVIDDAARHPVDEDAVVGAARRDSPDRIHSIMFTSGTSGMPKGCPMRVGGMSHVLHSQSWLLDEHSGAAALMQPHNSRGIAPAQTLQTWKAGGAVVMTGQAFDAVGVTDAIRHLGVTFIVLTPAMVHDMATHLAAQPVDVGSVRRIQVGGDAVTKGVLSRCAALFPQAQVCVNHGMTEGGGSFIWPFLATPVSSIPFYGEMCPIGAVAPGSIVRIWDPKKMHVVGRGELGELHISSPSLIRHYLQGRSDDSFYHDASGTWFNTGDVAMADKEGLVFILGRRKDMIERAGVPVMPAAIESSVEAFTGAQVSLQMNIILTYVFPALSTIRLTRTCVGGRRL